MLKNTITSSNMAETWKNVATRTNSVHSQQQEIFVRQFGEHEALQRNGQQRIRDEHTLHIVQRELYQVADEDKGRLDDVIELPQIITVVLQRVLVNAQRAQRSHEGNDAYCSHENERTGSGPLILQERKGGHADHEYEEKGYKHESLD